MYIIMNPNDKCHMLCVDNIHIIFGFLLQNGFSINTDLTKLMFKSQVQIKNLIAFISK